MTSYPTDVLIGVIGGSGIYSLEFMQNPVEFSLNTPFGRPSGDFRVAEVDGIKCAFLPRHGHHHTFTPSEVPYRANVYAMKMLGVRYILAMTAVGSLTPTLRPGDFAIVSQVIDRTTQRKSTFFGDGLVAHVSLAESTCTAVSEAICRALRPSFTSAEETTAAAPTLHISTTALTIEGPAFASVAESRLHASMGAHVVGMTTATEAKLCREAEIAYGCVGMVTDEDAWAEKHVSVEMVMEVARRNAERVQHGVVEMIREVGRDGGVKSLAHDALRGAIMTPMPHVPAETKQRVKKLIEKYE